MTILEAITVYLALAHKENRTDHETRAFACAWGVIYPEADRIIANFR